MTDKSTPAPAQNAAPQFKRRTIFIKKSLQLRYMLMIIFSVLIGLGIMAFELTVTLDEIFDRYPVLVQPLYENILPIMTSFAYKISLYVLCVVVISALVSHKMAGPVYRFEQVCKAIAKGDYSQRVHLRKGDQLMELQDEFNNMMDKIESDMKNKK
ncbi:HAMP domain-containing protein [Candidatus Avelusimicrobium aviculae]|uniref:HAMP domain-containing protein n=1 Tax=Candidatus Avelusimicrobium aviculae TaxID=3416206 RepID=UPI003D0E16D6